MYIKILKKKYQEKWENAYIWQFKIQELPGP